MLEVVRRSVIAMVLGILGSCMPLLAGTNPQAGGAADAKSSSQPVTINNLQVIPGRNEVQIAISETRTVVPSVTTLPRPTRIVLNFPNVLSALIYDHLEVKQNGIKAVRIGRHENPLGTRIVFDLANNLHYSLSTSPNGIKLRLSQTATKATQTDTPSPATGDPQEPSIAIDTPSDSAPASAAENKETEPATSATANTDAPQLVTTLAVPTLSDPPSPKLAQKVRLALISKPVEQVIAASKDALPPLMPAQKTQENTVAQNVMEKQDEAVAAASAGVPNAPNTNATTRVGNTRAVPADFVVGPEDVLAIDVWKEQEISRTVPIRPDGKISLPLVGELAVTGMTTAEVRNVITDKLQEYMSNPEVTVMVQTIKSQYVNVVGQVLKPGSYVLSKQMTVLDALALSGGFKDFAKLKKIYVLRPAPDGSNQRLAFNYKEVIKGRKFAQNIELQLHDTVVVP